VGIFYRMSIVSAKGS